MTPELKELYRLAAKPYYDGGGAITADQCALKSWRYFLEINSACNLHCPSCTKGNKEGYEHQNGLMDMDTMIKVLDKIKSENPNAIVFTYGNSEPFLHPKLPECIIAIRERGLNAELSTNLNYIQRVPELLDARPGLIIISLSGFTQEVYVKGHAGGNIEKVKSNLRTIAAINNSRPEIDRINILVNYHVYNDNQHEIALMKEFAKNVGVGFFTSYARAISMENAIQYCRSKDPDVTPYELQESRPDWNAILPPISQNYVGTMDRLKIPPDKAREMYKHYPTYPVCPVGDMFTFIRHDGKTSLCACVADRRIVLGDYLKTTQDELSESRRGHAICKQCTKYRMNLYFHIVDRKQWESPT